MDTHIQEIKDKIIKQRAKLRKYSDALDALQDICKHNWEYDGHGHNSKFYTCSKCGIEQDE